MPSSSPYLATRRGSSSARYAPITSQPSIQIIVSIYVLVVYFFARTVGSFLGGVLLMKYAEKNFFIASVILGFSGLILMLTVPELWAAYAGVVVFGLGYSNLFGIIMANAIKYRPERANEISALLVMGISGGGVLPPLMGVITDATGTQWAAVITIAAVWLYLFWLIGKMYLRKSQ